MALLVGWMIVLSALTLLNLLFTLGVVRRLREHTKLLSRSSGADGVGVMTAAGERVRDFSAATADGVRVSRASFAAPTLVGFFSPQCKACGERLPRFVSAAAAVPSRQAQVMAVIVGGDEDEVARLRGELGAVATVLTDSDQGEIVRAYGVTGYPAFAVVDADGLVLSSGYDLDQISLPVAP
jgi:peroxiredoxin